MKKENQAITYKNNMKISFEAKSENEGLARLAVAAFITYIDPTIEELNDVKTAVSEAVTNSIVHGYNEGQGTVEIECSLEGREKEMDNGDVYMSSWLEVTVTDMGVGIDDIEKAKQPLYTTKPEEDRSGMGFMFMDMLMDKVEVESQVDKGTRVKLRKVFKRQIKKA